jgi:hypothetical protein
MSQWIWTTRRPAYGNEQHATLPDIHEKKESVGNNVLNNEKTQNPRKKNVTVKLLKSKHIKKGVAIMISFLLYYFLCFKIFLFV